MLLTGQMGTSSTAMDFTVWGVDQQAYGPVELPTLVSVDHPGTQVLSGEAFRQLALVARYDGHFSREMYRALAMLLVLRNGGAADLEQLVGRKLGLKTGISEGQG